MKITKKIVALFLAIIMISSNFAYAATTIYSRDGGIPITDLRAKVTTTKEIQVDTDVAYSVTVPMSNLEIYDYNSTNEKRCTGNNEKFLYTTDKNKYFLAATAYVENESQAMYACIRFPGEEAKYTNVATLIYRDLIVYNGSNYDLKVNVKEIRSEGDAPRELRFLLGTRTSKETDTYNLQTYTNNTYFDIGMAYSTPTGGTVDQTDKTEIETDLYILDKNGREHAISGVYRMSDLDLGQGMMISGFVPNINPHTNSSSDGISNVWPIGDNSANIKYKLSSTNSTYFYSENNDNIEKGSDLGLFIKDKSKLNVTYTFQGVGAYSAIGFLNGTTRIYDVTFNSKGGSITPENQRVAKSEKATAPTGITKTGYTLKGWKITGQTELYDFSKPVTSDLNLEAVWEENEYTITYNLNSGTNNSANPAKFKYTDTVNFKNPTRAGYTFGGWYENANFSGNKVSSISNRASNLTLYAKWTPNTNTKYTINRYLQNVKGGYDLVSQESKTGETDKTVTADDDGVTTYTGYTENTQKSTKSGKITADGKLVLSVYYDRDVYGITYVLNGNNATHSNPETFTTIENVTFTPATRAGYTFEGWYEDEAFTKPITSTQGKSTNLTVYAKWKEITDATYKVNYYQQQPNGEYELIKTDELSEKVGNKVVAVSQQFDGYVENTTHSNRVAEGTVTYDGKLTLNLYYDIATYKINYNLNEGTNSSLNPNTYTINTIVTFQEPTREGYTFGGWYENEDFTKAITSTLSRTGDITVYAKWEAANVAYKVEHYKESKDGEYELIVTDDLTGKTGTKIVAETKEYTGFKENTTKSTKEGTVKADGSLVLKVYYDKEQYTVKFDPQNNTKMDDQTIKYQDKVKEPTTPVREGYEFKYWYYKNDKGEEVRYNFDDPVTENIQLIAKWEAVVDPNTGIPQNTTTNTTTQGTTDQTTATKVLPKTGTITIALISIVAVAVITALGVRYYKIKNMMKY